MLRLHVAVDHELASEVVSILQSEPAVSELSVLRGASIEPPGDVVNAAVAREAANGLVDRLMALGVAERGTLHLEPVHTWASAAGLAAERLAPGSSADSVVWADVTQRAYEDSEPNWTYLTLTTLATLLAGVAIVLDSQILVIGAMVIGPEFGAVAALGVALVRRRVGLFGRALATLVGGFAVGITVTVVAAAAGGALGWITRADVTADRPQTGFVYTPDRWSLVVALIAAAAGVLALTSSRVGGLSGVFISVTTVPAAANVALGLTFGVWSEVWGSTLQLGVNLVAMTVAGWITLLIQQTVWSRVSTGRARIVERRRARRST